MSKHYSPRVSANPLSKLYSNFSLLALCLIALAAILIAPKPAQAQAPAAPANFRVQELSPDKIVLAFDNPQGFTGVQGIAAKRQSREDTTVWLDVIVSAFTQSNSKTGMELSDSEAEIIYANGGTTQYRVRVRMSGVWSEWAYVDVTVPTTVSAPAAPTGLSTSGITQTSITLHWTKSSGATYYEVRTGTTGSFMRLGNVSMYNFVGLNAGASYILQVRAGNTGGTSSPAHISASTNSAPPPSAPAAPTGLSTSGTTQNSITLHWTKSSGATYYEVRTGTTGSFMRLGNVSMYNFVGLNAGASYILQVRAGNTGGTSSPAHISAMTSNAPPPSAPAAPTGLSTSGTTQNSITLHWTKSSGATYYEVRTGTTGSFMRLDDVSMYNFVGLSAGTSYTLQVRAGNTGGTSSPAQISASTNSAPPPSAPAMPTGLSTSGTTQNSITLHWMQSSGATYYEVRTGTTGSFMRLGNVSMYNFVGLNANTSYTLQVRAGNTGGTSSPAQISASTNNVPPPSAPAMPTNLSTSGTTQNSITLHWTKSSGATYYEVRTGTTGNFMRLDDVSMYNFVGLSADTSYTLQVRAGNTGGTSSPAQISASTAASAQNAPPVEPPAVTTPPAQDSGDSQDKRRASSSSQKATPTPRATQGFYQSLNNLPPGIEVNNWMMGAQGRRVGALGVGNQAIIDQGLLDAIDMWGYITPGIEVCFAQFGRLVLLDAAYSPRRIIPLASYQRDGMTCAIIDRAGTVVLLRSAAPLPSQDMAPLQNCMVYLQYALNFRDAPDGNIMSILPAFIWLTALDYREGWFKVDYHGQQGWINADYVQTRGDCGFD